MKFTPDCCELLWFLRSELRPSQTASPGRLAITQPLRVEQGEEAAPKTEIPLNCLFWVRALALGVDYGSPGFQMSSTCGVMYSSVIEGKGTTLAAP